MESPTKSSSSPSSALRRAQGGQRQAVRQGTTLLTPLKASANISRPKKHPLGENVDCGNSRELQPPPKRKTGRTSLPGPSLIGSSDNARDIKPDLADLDALSQRLDATTQKETSNAGKASAWPRSEPKECINGATGKSHQPQSRKQAPTAKMHAQQEQEQTSVRSTVPAIVAAAEANASLQIITNSSAASATILATPPTTPPHRPRATRFIPGLRKAAAVTQPHGSVRFGFLDEGGAYNELDRGKFTESILAGILADFRCSLGGDAYVTGIVVRLREGSSSGSSGAGTGASPKAALKKEAGEEEEVVALRIPCVTYPPGPDDPRLAEFVAQPALWERSRRGLEFVVQATVLEKWHAVAA